MSFTPSTKKGLSCSTDTGNNKSRKLKWTYDLHGRRQQVNADVSSPLNVKKPSNLIKGKNLLEKNKTKVTQVSGKTCVIENVAAAEKTVQQNENIHSVSDESSINGLDDFKTPVNGFDHFKSLINEFDEIESPFEEYDDWKLCCNAIDSFDSLPVRDGFNTPEEQIIDITDGGISRKIYDGNTTNHPPVIKRSFTAIDGRAFLCAPKINYIDNDDDVTPVRHNCTLPSCCNRVRFRDEMVDLTTTGKTKQPSSPTTITDFDDGEKTYDDGKKCLIIDEQNDGGTYTLETAVPSSSSDSAVAASDGANYGEKTYDDGKKCLIIDEQTYILETAVSSSSSDSAVAASDGANYGEKTYDDGKKCLIIDEQNDGDRTYTLETAVPSSSSDSAVAASDGANCKKILKTTCSNQATSSEQSVSSSNSTFKTVGKEAPDRNAVVIIKPSTSKLSNAAKLSPGFDYNSAPDDGIKQLGYSERPMIGDYYGHVDKVANVKQCSNFLEYENGGGAGVHIAQQNPELDPIEGSYFFVELPGTNIYIEKIKDEPIDRNLNGYRNKVNILVDNYGPNRGVLIVDNNNNNSGKQNSISHGDDKNLAMEEEDNIENCSNSNIPKKKTELIDNKCGSEKNGDAAKINVINTAANAKRAGETYEIKSSVDYEAKENIGITMENYRHPPIIVRDDDDCCNVTVMKVKQTAAKSVIINNKNDYGKMDPKVDSCCCDKDETLKSVNRTNSGKPTTKCGIDWIQINDDAATFQVLNRKCVKFGEMTASDEVITTTDKKDDVKIEQPVISESSTKAQKNVCNPDGKSRYNLRPRPRPSRVQLY